MEVATMKKKKKTHQDSSLQQTTTASQEVLEKQKESASSSSDLQNHPDLELLDDDYSKLIIIIFIFEIFGINIQVPMKMKKIK